MRTLTPPGRGGISVLEIEGSDAEERLLQFANRLPKPGELAVVALRDGGRELETALVVCETKECFELHLTGSPPLVEVVLDLLGGEPALEPDCIEARALLGLAHATSEAGARILLDQFRGALRRSLLDHMGDSDADWKRFAEQLLEAGRVAGAALSPKRVVLAGAVNAGKSTLFNLLVGSERVIVSDEPGTTRDAVTAEIQLGDWPVVLVDTAGEREFLEAGGERGAAPREVLERAGQAIGRRLREEADLVLWLEAAGNREKPGRDLERVCRVVSRVDERADSGEPGERSLSCLVDPQGARRLVEEIFRDFFGLPESAWIRGAAVPVGTALRDGLLESLSPEPDRALRARTSVMNLLGPNPATGL